MGEEKSIQERVDDITTTSFSIAGCPIKTHKAFMEFCEENAKITKIFYDKRSGQKQVKEELCYSIGLQRLLDISDADAKVQMLYDRIVQLEDKFVEMEGKSDKDKRVIKTMGRREIKEEVLKDG